MEHPILKVFGAEQWHDSVDIIGNKKSLKELRDTIDRALSSKHGAAASDEFMEADGEGYQVSVIKLEEDWEKYQDLPLHYTNTVIIGGSARKEQWENLANLLMKRMS